MKRMRAILCGVLAALTLAGCGGAEEVVCRSERPDPAVDLTQYAIREAAYPVYPKEPRLEDYTDENGMGGDWDAYLADVEVWEAELQALGMNVEPESGAVLNFAGRTAGKIFAGPENTVYSPISLYVALGMLTELTDGQTKQQVMDLLGAADTEALRQQIKDLWLSVYRDNDAVCRLANAAFLRENADVKQPAVDTLAEGYYASSYRVPMGTEEADKAIAGWLNQQTGGLLSEETGNIRTDTDNLLRLYNTIYYKAGWRAAFEGDQTKADIFTAADGSEQQVDFMHQTETGDVLRGEGYTAAPKRLRYGRMVFVLPDEGVTPESLLQREGFLTELTGEYDFADVVWSVPKFDVKSSVDLKAILKALGVTDAFDDAKADFTPLTDSGAVVSSVMQAARVRIDEEGVEAAAYTEIVADTTSAMDPPVVEMDLDRPFLFVIFSDADVPLFVGTVQTMEG